MSDIIILLGNTGAGKDTLYSSLVAAQPKWHSSPLVNIKVVGYEKREWEKRWNLPYMALEQRSVKAMRVPGRSDGATYGDLMVRAFQQYDHLGFRASQMSRYRADIEWYLANGFTPVLTDIRMPDETEVIDSIWLNATQPLNVQTFLISRQGETPLPSDIYLGNNSVRLDRVSHGTVELKYNDSTGNWANDIWHQLAYRERMCDLSRPKAH